MIRRLAALVLLEPELDQNYQLMKSHAFAWQTADKER